MPLFDNSPRHISSPAIHNESTFQFLNRVDSPYWEEVRRLLERWYMNLPASQHSDIRERFRAPDNRQLMSAFWELYLHEIFTRLGFTLAPHPGVAESSSKPDYYVSRHDGDFYLEAVMLGELEDERRAERRRASIYDAINQIPSPNFWLEIECLRETQSTPPLRSLKQRLGEWLLALDPDDSRFVDFAARPEHWKSLPFHDWRQDGWHIHITAIPKGPRFRGELHAPTIGIYMPSQAIMINDQFEIRERLKDKAKKYGQTGKPYVIALLSQRVTTSDLEILAALYGSEWECPQSIREGSTRQGGSDGLWLSEAGPSRRNVSAVLVSTAVRPWMVARANVTIIHNPWAVHPVTAELPFVSVNANLLDGTLRTGVAASSPAEIFGIDPNWPPGEPFPKS